MPDDTIIKYYLDVEFTPFPVLVIEEYNRRFKRKSKDELINDLKYQARLARKKTRELRNLAKKNQLVDDVTRQKSYEILQQAEKKGYQISESIARKGGVLGSRITKGTKSSLKKGLEAGRGLTSKQKNLDLLKKLGELKKAGIITQQEFQAKKKKILSRI